MPKTEVWTLVIGYPSEPLESTTFVCDTRERARALAEKLDFIMQPQPHSRYGAWRGDRDDKAVCCVEWHLVRDWD